MESMIDASKTENKAESYDYVSKNDRLTLNGKSYALKDAKVIFAVKPHSADTDYIQHVSAIDGDKRVDEDDVIAVKVTDIPDISKTDDTIPNTLDKKYNASSVRADKTWIGDDKSMVAIAADKNKDVDAAVLGVNNFNKFNAGSTKVGLVTNVSYDKNDVVSIDVATNGKVETLSSVEKTSFDDVVSVLDYTNKTTTKSYSVASRTEKITNGLMANSTLKDYLNKNGAYAEITTNADGKLTGVLFMDEKTDFDGFDDTTTANKDGVNVGNVVIGDYYQVSRKVVADVKEGSWMSVIKGSAEYADADNFKTLDTKDEQKAADFTSDATYYLIDGKPTKHTGAYVGKASVVDGFDGNPDIKVAEASDVRKSDIRNDGDSANDIYNVADVASKIDDNGAGDIVAVYMYDDDMGEKISIKGAKVELANSGTITVGQENLDVTVTLPKDENLDTSKVYVQVVDKDGKVVIAKTNVTDAAQKLVLNTKDLKEGTYTVQLFGYNKTDKNDDLLAEATLTVGAAAKYTVSKVEWVTKTGDPSDVPVVEAGTNGVFYVKVTSDPANAVLAKENLEVRVKGSKVDFELVSMGNGVYKITVANAGKIEAKDQVGGNTQGWCSCNKRSECSD